VSPLPPAAQGVPDHRLESSHEFQLQTKRGELRLTPKQPAIGVAPRVSRTQEARRLPFPQECRPRVGRSISVPNRSIAFSPMAGPPHDRAYVVSLLLPIRFPSYTVERNFYASPPEPEQWCRKGLS